MYAKSVASGFKEESERRLITAEQDESPGYAAIIRDLKSEFRTGTETVAALSGPQF